jgi:pilus assembly protein Flp/PilA
MTLAGGGFGAAQTNGRYFMVDRFNLLVARTIGRMTELREREDGQALVEYALILALISVVAIGVLTTIGSGVVAKLTSVSNAL